MTRRETSRTQCRRALILCTFASCSVMSIAEARPQATALPVKKIAVTTSLYRRRRPPRAKTLIRGSRYLLWAARSSPGRALIAEYTGRRRPPGATRLIDLDSRRQLARAGAPGSSRELGAYHTVFGAGGRPTLLRSSDGRVFTPRVQLPGGVPVVERAIFHSPDGSQVWVFARGAQGPAYYARWRSVSSQQPLKPTRSLVVMPNASTFNEGAGALEVFKARRRIPVPGRPAQRALPGECGRYRLRPGKPALCRISNPDSYGWKTQWLSGDWLAFDVSRRGGGRGVVFGDANVLDTRSGALSRLPAGCRGYNGVATVLIHPPRVLTTCYSTTARAATIWSPSWVKIWRAPPWFGAGFRMNVIRPVIPLHPGMDKPGRYFIDLERGVAFETPPLLLYTHGSTPRLRIALRKRGKRQDLVIVDFARATARVVASYRDCPRGQIWERARSGKRIGIICQNKHPRLFSFRHVWSEVIDVERGTRWRLRRTIEHLLPDGRAIVSDRRRMAAESYNATRWIGLLDLRPKTR